MRHFVTGSREKLSSSALGAILGITRHGNMLRKFAVSVWPSGAADEQPA
jgi:hypothetical protein